MKIFDIVINVLNQFASAVPAIVGAIAVAIVGWIIAKVVSKAIQKVLESIRVDKLADHLNDIEFIEKTKVKILPSKVLSKIIYYVLMLVFLMAAAEVLNMPIVSKMMGDLISYIPSLLTAMLLFIVGILLADFIKNIILTTCNALGIPSGKIIANFIFYLVFLTLTISALQQAAIATDLISANLSIILAGLMLAFSLGYGLASKDTMANFLASFYVRKKIKIGDVIGIDGAKGRVIEMDTASLTIKDDEKVVVIPLKEISNKKVDIFEE